MAVLRAIGRMASEWLVADRGVDAHQLRAIFAALPGLHEWLWDAAPPASGAQDCRGHDHSGSNNHGGVPIPRNAILDVGFGAGGNYMWSAAIPNGSVWTEADYQYIPQRYNDLGYHWNAYVDVDLDTATYGGLYAEGWVFLQAPGTVDVRIRNETTTSNSSSQSYTGGASLIHALHIENIPVSGDARNKFTLQYSYGGDGTLQVATYGVIIAEVYRAGADSYGKYATPLTQPPQAGEVG